MDTQQETSRWKSYGGRIHTYRDLWGYKVSRLWICPFYWIEWKSDLSGSFDFRDRLGNQKNHVPGDPVFTAVNLAGEWLISRNTWAEYWAKCLARYSNIDGYCDSVSRLVGTPDLEYVDLSRERNAFNEMEFALPKEIAMLHLIGYWWVDPRTGNGIFNHSLSGFDGFNTLIIKRFRTYSPNPIIGLLLPDQHDEMQLNSLEVALDYANEWIESWSHIGGSFLLFGQHQEE